MLGFRVLLFGVERYRHEGLSVLSLGVESFVERRAAHPAVAVERRGVIGLRRSNERGGQAHDAFLHLLDFLLDAAKILLQI